MSLVQSAAALREALAQAGAKRAHLTSVRDTVAAARAALDTEITTLSAEAVLLTHCGKGFEVLLDALSHESLAAVEQLLSYGLRTAFPDLPLSCRFEVTTKRGQQWLDIILMDGKVQAPILDAFGGGPASVISLLLRLLVCRRLKLAPVILLDEPFSFVSEQYVPGVAQLLRELAEKLNLTLVLVTHQPAFLDAAHVAYRIGRNADGTAVFTAATV